MTRNASVLKCGRSLEKFTEMVQSLKALLERFVESLSYMDQCFVTARKWSHFRALRSLDPRG